jgi:hypothetical protein
MAERRTSGRLAMIGSPATSSRDSMASATRLAWMT